LPVDTISPSFRLILRKPFSVFFPPDFCTSTVPSSLDIIATRDVEASASPAFAVIMTNASMSVNSAVSFLLIVPVSPPLSEIRLSESKVPHQLWPDGQGLLLFHPQYRVGTNFPLDIFKTP